MRKLAAEKVKEVVQRFDPRAQVEFISENRAVIKVANDVIPRIIGREGKNIKKLEERLGISIDVEPAVESLGKEVGFRAGESGRSVALLFKKRMSGTQANIYVEGEYLFTATIGRKGDIKVSKDSDIGRTLIRALSGKKEIKVFV